MEKNQSVNTLILEKTRLVHPLSLAQLMVGVNFAEPSVLVVISLSLGIWLLIQRHRTEAITLVIATLDAVDLNYLLKQRLL